MAVGNFKKNINHEIHGLTRSKTQRVKLTEIKPLALGRGVGERVICHLKKIINIFPP
jgi:hypothetical protein